MGSLRKWFFVSLLISVLSLVIVLYLTVDPDSIMEVLLNIRPGFILLAVCLHIFSFIIWGMRTKIMSRELGFNVKFLSAFKIVTSSTFLASITPSSIGGEPLRIHLLNKEEIPLGSATAVVIGERFLDAILILVAAPVSLHLLRGRLASYGLGNAVIFGELFLVFIFGMVLYSMWSPDSTKKVFVFLVKKCFSGTESRCARLIMQLEYVIDEFHESMCIFVSKGRYGLMQGFFYTLMFWVIEFSMVPVILLGLNQDPSILIAFAVQVLLMILLVMPLTPGASGVAEFGAISMFSIFVPASVVGIVVMAWRAFTLYLNLLVGGLVSLKVLKDTQYIQELMNDSK